MVPPGRGGRDAVRDGAAGPPRAGDRPGQPPAHQWPLPLHALFPAERILHYLLQALAAMLLLLKLSDDAVPDRSADGWMPIFGVLAVGHLLCAALDAYAFRGWRDSPQSANPILRCVRMRGVCEAGYCWLQHTGMLLVVLRLPEYIADAVRRADAGGAGFGSGDGFDDDGDPEPLGVHVNEDAPVSISSIMTPLWLAWLAQECVSIFFDASRASVPAIANQELREQLHALIKSIRIRPRAATFVLNVQLSFCARMLDSAYGVSWVSLFILAWVAFGFLLLSLFGFAATFLASHCVDGMSGAAGVYRRVLCGSPRRVAMA